jgi:hypothetical protein
MVIQSFLVWRVIVKGHSPRATHVEHLFSKVFLGKTVIRAISPTNQYLEAVDHCLGDVIQIRPMLRRKWPMMVLA